MNTKMRQSSFWWNHMGWTRVLRVCAAIGLALIGLAHPPSLTRAAEALSIEPALAWNTFLGSADTDMSLAIAVDGSRNVYIAGVSKATWGNPVRAYSGNTGENDAFVAKLDLNGALLWNTFLGSADSDIVFSIATDGTGNVVVAGSSTSTWGAPLVAHALGTSDAFVAKLNSSGALLWNTFTGSSSQSDGVAAAIDRDGNVYATGSSYSTWGSPLLSFGGARDGFVAKYNPSGVLQWNTFLGGADDDDVRGIAIDGSGNLVLAGDSYASWGSPLAAFAGGEDAFVAQLGHDGALKWHTFLGSTGDDNAIGMTADSSGNIAVIGNSITTWGNPLLPISGNGDAFVAQLDSSGARIWNTFLGSGYADAGNTITMDGSGRITVGGYSIASWGSPVNPASGSMDAFVAQLDRDGRLLWNTFLGSPVEDMGWGVAVDLNGDVYTTGVSASTWGNPLSPFVGLADAFVAKIGVPHALFLPAVIR